MINEMEIRKRHETAETCIEFPEDTIGYFAHKDRGFLLDKVIETEKENEDLRATNMSMTNAVEMMESEVETAESNLSRLVEELSIFPNVGASTKGGKGGMVYLHDILNRYRPTIQAAPQNPSNGELARLECEWVLLPNGLHRAGCNITQTSLGEGGFELRQFCAYCGGKIRLKAEVRDE